MLFNNYFAKMHFIDIIFVQSQIINDKTMKQFLILAVFIFLGFNNLNAQSNLEIQNEEKTALIITEVSKEMSVDKKTSAKKKDILNAKINSKLQGKVDLFFVADKSIVC